MCRSVDLFYVMVLTFYILMEFFNNCTASLCSAIKLSSMFFGSLILKFEMKN
ncbi:hypothetical protein ECH_0051 [Ehrlichia chaffeensis str. Arkansas]|uniref:Uncharacterized protein n=1 Tax=Ehrlichia chaffeensis (strain ATCC CRL-10679 / Arkansas) TaxID=205920 RepID=Q2GI51_EHRCR|nr:hypothetical protein ECH_0051 [Ehrlichia chaffeensis str. Arkansas]